MNQDNKNRVLGRSGAHQLTQEQIERVAGGELTVPCWVITGFPAFRDVNTDS
jgi:hypothetical protein